MRDETIHWWRHDFDALPDAVSDAWTLTTAGSPVVGLVEEGVHIAVGGTSSAVYSKPSHPDDVSATTRVSDSMELQAYVRGRVGGTNWASGAHSTILEIDDGVRRVALSIGPTLQFIDPTDGTVLAPGVEDWPWRVPANYLVRKTGTDRWTVFVGQREALSMPYQLGIAGVVPGYRFGIELPGGLNAGEAFFNDVEVGLNMSLPQRWRVTSSIFNLLFSLRTRLTRDMEAFIRTAAGMLETPLNAMKESWRGLTAGGGVIETAVATGTRLPDAEITPWTLGTPGAISVLRDRVRMIGTTTEVSIERALAELNDATECRVSFWCRIEGAIELGAKDDGPPQIQIWNGTRVATFESLSPGFPSAMLGMGLDGPGRTPFLVNAIGRDMFVECYLIPDAGAIVVVDGRIIDVEEWSSLTLSATAAAVRIAVPATSLTTFDIWNVEVEVGRSDVNRRPLFLQNAVERLMFPGGCEENPALEVWMRHHHGVQQMRGTTRGMINEINRMTCSAAAAVYTKIEPGSWYLECSYPEVTPIYLELDGDMVDVYVEFPNGAVNFTTEGFADLLAKYIVPLSVEELQFFVALQTKTTGAATTTAGVSIEYPVTDATGFSVSDEIIIHDPDEATPNYFSTTVQAVDTVGNTITTPDDHTAYSSGAHIIRLIRTT